MSNHKKHDKLPRPFSGAYARQEWAIMGAPCSDIRRLAQQVTEHLGGRWKTAYLDADHHGEEQFSTEHPHLEYTDKIRFHRIDFKGTLNPFQFRPVLFDRDLVLLNGNHYTAEKQILAIDPRKADSVRRKMDRLTDVRMVLFAEGVEAIPSFLTEQLPGLASLPAFSMSDSAAVAAFLEKQLQEAIPRLYGLVLAGGKSERMGQDKSLLEYHGVPQRDYAFGLLQDFCEKTFLSVRPDQDAPDALKDVYLGLGPYGAILSAFQAFPDKAWLALACDLPLVSAEALRFLIAHRNPSKMATAFQSPAEHFPDPLLTIWEPRSYLTLLQFLAQGFSCPRKALINSDIELLQAPDPGWLRNVNTPEDYNQVIEEIRKRQHSIH